MNKDLWVFSSEGCLAYNLNTEINISDGNNKTINYDHNIDITVDETFTKSNELLSVYQTPAVSSS